MRLVDGLLAALQVLEPKVPFFSTPKGNVVSIFLKLAMSYVLIGVTGGLTSSYYLILLLPLVSAGTRTSFADALRAGS